MTRKERSIVAIGVVILISLLWFWGSQGKLNDREMLEAEPTAYEPVIRHHLSDATTEVMMQVGLATTTHETTTYVDPTTTYVYEEPTETAPAPEMEETTTPDATESTYSPDWEITLLVYQVWGEIGICDGGADYYGMKLQAAVVLNRIRSGWGSSIAEVIYQPGQFVTWWYEQLMSQGPYPSQSCWDAVYEVLACNDTPAGLIYADSRSSVPAGCYLYYQSPTGQRFYCTY